MLIFLFYYFFLAAPIFSFHGRLDWKEHEPDWVGIKFETNQNSEQVVGESFSEKTELEAKAITVNSKHGEMERLYVNNGNRTESSPIRFVILQVINKITQSSDLLITSMITDRI